MNAKKEAINAIKNLVQKKDFSDITVQDILNEAEISRGTFYKYYKDKYDLANDFYNSYVSKIIIKYNGSNLEEIFCDILFFIKNNKEYFININSFKEVNSFISYLTKRTYSMYYDIYKYNLKKEKLSKIEEYQVHSISGTCIFSVERWLRNNCDIDARILAKNILAIIPTIFTTYQY